MKKKKLVIVEVKEFLNNTWKYKNNKLYKLHKLTKKWCCLNNKKPKDDGYIQALVTLSLNNKKNYYLNRLVYYFHNQDWNINDSSSNNEIDHKNQNRLDNRIENLKVVNRSQNQQNKKTMNKKPIQGIGFIKNKKKPWRARWFENGKEKTKHFETQTEALAYRKKMIELHYYQG